MPAFLDTGLNVVDAADTALGHLQALERGRPGERYILGCRNMTLQQIFEELARISGRPAPKVRIPYALAYAAGVATTAWASITGQEPRAPLDAVRMARKKMWVSTAKAERELGFQPGPAEQALGKAAQWFVENGYVA
jgi:dihydroflavonol-4-reductase